MLKDDLKIVKDISENIKKELKEYITDEDRFNARIARILEKLEKLAKIKATPEPKAKK